MNRHPDPFYIKEEFAPSDRGTLSKKQQLAHNLLAPHSRLLLFLGSHFNATRLGSPHVQKTFLRLLRTTLDGLMHSTGHPLAREIRFQIILFGLKALKYSSVLSTTAQWRLKNQILSAALSWFVFAPRWSFGSNRLQLKAEMALLGDVVSALQTVEFIGAHDVGAMKSFKVKEELLHALIANEQVRLRVWLFPLNDLSGSNVRDPPEVSNVCHPAMSNWLIRGIRLRSHNSFRLLGLLILV